MAKRASKTLSKKQHKRLALPIDARLDEIAAAIRDHEGLVLSAEPGAGKTTRVPARMLDHIEGQIIVVQPRRIAARLAAKRVSDELGAKLGGRVGYQVRFDRKASKDTRLLFVTEGILMRRLAGKAGLEGVGAVVFDELHERHLQSDLALALCVEERVARRAAGKSLQIVAMSATLDAAPVATYLDAPHVHVEGRTFPVSIEYQVQSKPLEVQVASAVSTALKREEDGDVLVFLPGAAEIRRAAQKCKGLCERAGAELAILHGDLPAKAQDEVVRSEGKRKVILSTNVAESSVTLPRVTTVIDSGLARMASHSPFTGLPTLGVRKIAQASAIQRAGRAGRVREGHAIRLYAEQDFRRRPAHETPEIARLDLSDAALLLRAYQRDPRTFPYFEAPPKASIDAAELLLERLGLIDDDGITQLGRNALRLPVHARLARLAIEGERRGVGRRACMVAALLSERPIKRGGRPDVEASADVICDLEDLERADAEGLRPHELRARGIDETAARNVRRVTDQLVRLARATEIRAGLEDEEEDLRACIVTAFPDRVGKLDGRRLVFAGGGSGELDEGCVVRQGAFAVATSVQDRSERGGRGATRIRGACEVDGEMLLELFEARITSEDSVRFDKATKQVESISALVYEGLELDASIRRDTYGDDVRDCLVQAAFDAGLTSLFDMKEVELLQRRVEHARKGGLEIDAIDDEALRRALESACTHLRSFADLRKVDLAAALLASLGPAAARLHKLAPTAISLPRRKRVPVNYEVDRPPWIASRLQDFFGMKVGPRAGHEPLVLHLLAPNRRAVQVTTDLEGFWERHYPALRKQLMRRYPRHDWREDPLSAAPPKKPNKPKR